VYRKVTIDKTQLYLLLVTFAAFDDFLAYLLLHFYAV